MTFFMSNIKFVQSNNILTLSKRNLMNMFKINTLTLGEFLDSDDWISSWG